MMVLHSYYANYALGLHWYPSCNKRALLYWYQNGVLFSMCVVPAQGPCSSSLYSSNLIGWPP